LNAKNLLEAKKVVKKILKKELSEKQITSQNVGHDVAFIKSEKTFCLVKFLDKARNDLNNILPNVASKIEWNKYVVLEKAIFDKYIEQLDAQKINFPIKGTITFVLSSGEIYMISPYFLADLDNEYSLTVNFKKTKILCFPTVFLNVPEGLERSAEETEAQKRVALISQINNIGEDNYDLNYYDDDFDEEEGEFYSAFFSKRGKNNPLNNQNPKFSELFDDEIRNISLNLLYEMSRNLKDITKEIKFIRKHLRDK
jgi:hypothetical protein